MNSCTEVPSRASHFTDTANACKQLPFSEDWNFSAGKTHPQCRYQSVSQQTEALSSHPCAPPVGVGTHGVFGVQVKWRRTSPIAKSKTGNHTFPNAYSKVLETFKKCCPPCTLKKKKRPKKKKGDP